LNKCQDITGGIFYCRESAEIKVCGSLQTSLWLDSFVRPYRQAGRETRPNAKP